MEAVEQRPESVERHGAATRLDEHLSRRSRNPGTATARGWLSTGTAPHLARLGRAERRLPTGERSQRSGLLPINRAFVLFENIICGS